MPYAPKWEQQEERERERERERENYTYSQLPWATEWRSVVSFTLQPLLSAERPPDIHLLSSLSAERPPDIHLLWRMDGSTSFPKDQENPVRAKN
jgi:hypothetical protein